MSNRETGVESFNIHAMKVKQSWSNTIYNSLINDGEARFGWSYNEDLNALLIKNKKDSGEELSQEQQKNYFWWLTDDIKKGDYLAYINVPEYGQVTIAKVKKTYYWKKDMDTDFNHCFEIDKNTVYKFDRNSNIVSPYLSRRFKLQGKHWKIYDCHDDFNNLLNELQSGNNGEKREISNNIERFNTSIKNNLEIISNELYRNFPNKDLEKLLERVFKNIPNVISVENKEGSADKGADLIVKYDKKLPFLNNKEELWYVQVKSYTEICKTSCALDGLKKAIENYNDADLTEAIIATTSNTIDKAVEEEIEKYNNENKVKVKILYGAELVRFVLKYLDLENNMI